MTKSPKSVLAGALTDAYTDGGYETGWEDLPGIADVLKSGHTVDEFVEALRAVPAAQWIRWAEQLGARPPSPAEIEATITEVADILEPLAGIPVIVIDVE